MPARWSDEALDAWREVADPPADEAVAAYFASRPADEHADAGALVGSLVRHQQLPPEDQVPAVAGFLRAAAALPAWADEARMARGQRFFDDRALHQFTALYLSSLPNAYAAAKGAHVLWLTTRLQTDPVRRLNETAQFLMDVSAPGGFRAGGAATGRVLHVRLMHAAVRWLIEHDPLVRRVDVADPKLLAGVPTWAWSWGVPLNQEDLAGTLLTFTTVVLEALARSGVVDDEAAAEDHLHLWRVIGHLMGIAGDVLPIDLADARAAQVAIFRRQQRPSAAGRDLTATLLGLVHDRLPRPVAALAPAMLRHYVGDRVAGYLGVTSARWTRPVIAALVALTRLRSRESGHLPPWFSERIGRWMLDGLLAAGRDGDRVPFAIPDHLGALR